MATLREMLVKIYQPNKGLIDFGDGPGATQDGATNLAVLGGGPNQASGDQGGGGAVSFPAFRTAGVEGGGEATGSGGGGIDWSSIDWNDPGQVQRVRDYLERGGQAGEPGGAGAGGVEYGDPNAFVDPTLAELTGYFGPGPIGLVGSLGAAGMRGHNASLLDEAATAAGGTGLSGWQVAGAALGPTLGNNYGSYGYADTAAALNAAGAGRAAGTGGLGPNAGGWADSVVGLGPRESAASSWAGGLDDAPSSSYGGSSRNYDHSEARSRDGGGGGGAERGDMSGRGHTGASSERGRQSGVGGNYHDGGMVHGMPGEEVDATLLANEYVMSPEAVEMVGPDTFEQINNLARMMRGQHYPAR